MSIYLGDDGLYWISETGISVEDVKELHCEGKIVEDIRAWFGDCLSSYNCPECGYSRNRKRAKYCTRCEARTDLATAKQIQEAIDFAYPYGYSIPTDEEVDNHYDDDEIFYVVSDED